MRVAQQRVVDDLALDVARQAGALHELDGDMLVGRRVAREHDAAERAAPELLDGDVAAGRVERLALGDHRRFFLGGFRRSGRQGAAAAAPGKGARAARKRRVALAGRLLRPAAAGCCVLRFD